MEENELIEADGDLEIIIDEIEDIQQSSYPSDQHYWLSWVLFDTTFKSPEFSFSSRDCLKYKDTIGFKYYFRPESNYFYLPKEVLGIFPLKFFLCSSNGIISSCPFHLVEGSDPSEMLLKFPLIMKDRLEFQLQYPPQQIPIMRIRIGITICTRFNPTQTTLEAAPSLEASPLKDSTVGETMRHFKIHLNLHSLKGLLRPGYFSLNLSYPHFGTNGLVRTPPQYFQSLNETKINKGTIVYDFISTENNLQNVLGNYPINIDCLLKTPLGHERIGTWEVPILVQGQTLKNFFHAYRCPRSHKFFQKLEVYQASFADPNDIISPDTLYALEKTVDIKPLRSENLSAVLRIVIIIEDKGSIGKEVPLLVQSGYSHHRGGVYTSLPENDKEMFDLLNLQDPSSLNVDLEENDSDFPPSSRITTNDRLLLDWEIFRQKSEQEWRQALHEKEKIMRLEIERELNAKFANIFDDVKRSQQEIIKLEARLKNSLEMVDKEKAHLSLLKESCNTQLKQRLAELSIYARKCKIEAKNLAEQERQEKMILEKSLALSQQQLQLMERKLQQLQEKNEDLQERYSNSSEMRLRDEILLAKSKALQLQESLEEEKKKVAIVTLEKEALRSQMYKLATCLKREREKNNLIAKQELEQLRLEFLAREER